MIVGLVDYTNNVFGIIMLLTWFVFIFPLCCYYDIIALSQLPKINKVCKIDHGYKDVYGWSPRSFFLCDC
jgi:hypothetical protein